MDKSASLTPDVKGILLDKKTEPPHIGEYVLSDTKGTYLCRQCGKVLFRSSNKFLSSCGWPSFDDEIPGTIAREKDADGVRTEILCQNCNGHLGHVFTGEYLTEKNLRHCVNSLSIDFVKDGTVHNTEEVIVCGGCFWGIEALLKQEPGVLKTEVGYIGGAKQNPSYEEVCHGETGHIEAVRVIYDVDKTNAETIYKAFLESHDVTQGNESEIPIKQQYRSAIFSYNQNQTEVARRLLGQLEQEGGFVATKIMEMSPFWKAEAFHQDYYNRTGQTALCHRRTKRF